MARTRIIYSNKTGLKMAEYVDGVLIWNSDEYGVDSSPNYYIQDDIQPYRSAIDGTIITSRSQHRNHLREHNCIEIGNETKYISQRKELESPPGLKETISRVAYEKLRKLR